MEAVPVKKNVGKPSLLSWRGQNGVFIASSATTVVCAVQEWACFGDDGCCGCRACGASIPGPPAAFGWCIEHCLGVRFAPKTGARFRGKSYFFSSGVQVAPCFRVAISIERQRRRAFSGQMRRKRHMCRAETPNYPNPPWAPEGRGG